MKTPLKIAVAGLGTVGVGLVKIIHNHADLLSRRCGRPIVLTAVCARSKDKDRGINLDGVQWFDDAVKMAAEADADVVVELIGGSEGVAKDMAEAALSNGRHVVTANKALIAHHGTALAKLAEDKGVAINYEAAVAGGIPIIKSLREGLAGNVITHVYGILNGTCNYILSTMRDTGRDFDDVLKEAQELGYAEADPAFDIEGVDAAHKLAILASLAYGSEVDFAGVHIEGITGLEAQDIQFAEELGYRVKLLGVAQQIDGQVEQRVHPCLVPMNAPIASVEGVFNAVVCDGDSVDTVMQEGRGAGEGPTASAVAADIADIARGIILPTFGVPATELTPANTRPMSQRTGAYYVRMSVRDQSGVFAGVANALRDHDVSMESVLQRGRSTGEAVPLVMVLHETVEQKMLNTLDDIAKIDGVLEQPKMIRIENFN